MRAVALIALVTCLGCGGSQSSVNPTTPTTPTPPAASPSMTLSGQVFEVVPRARVPAPGIPLTAVVIIESGCSPPCGAGINRRWIREGTTSGPDGRYHFLLPVG